MSTRKEILSCFYGQSDEDGRTARSRHGQLEYATTMAYIHRYAARQSRILEVGAGTGRYSIALAKEGMESGRGFSGLFHDIDKKPAIGVICAGGISRTYSGNIIDLMGLNNLTVAHFPGERKGLKNHAAFETGVFEKLNVDIMPFPPDEDANKLLKGLCTNETFAASWRYGTLRRTDNADAQQLAMISKQCLESLLTTSKFEFSDELVWNGKAWIAAANPLPRSPIHQP